MLEDGTTFYLRFRYRIQGDFTFLEKGSAVSERIVYDEIMINGGNKIIKHLIKTDCMQQFNWIESSSCIRTRVFK
jgi:hypothetical protein